MRAKRNCLLLCLWLVFLISGSSCAYQAQNVFPLDNAYPRHNTLVAELNRISNAAPGLVKHRIIGFSDTESLPIYALELGKGERNILIIGQHHGEEVLGVALSLYYAESLSQRYDKDKRIREILNEYTLWIVPSLNPEGWRIVSEGVINSKRKNNRDTDKNGRLDLRTDGVDLNRNYPVFWDKDSELNPLSTNYKGSEPASEAEIKAIIQLGRQKDFSFAIFYHSSALGLLNERIFLPAVDKHNDKYLDLQRLAALYAKKTPRDYERGHYSLHLGPSSRVGNARNFFYHSLGVPAMLIEVGGINKAGVSVIHPPARILQKIQKRHLEALLCLLEAM
ncbi:MAG: M14 family zinc carboxypeptidase [Candidatus Cloacimonetes bacterium]|nr:M14 family zinc carboxypeptidase [Candidatus Cloacimonadota bacterium]